MNTVAEEVDALCDKLADAHFCGREEAVRCKSEILEHFTTLLAAKQAAEEALGHDKRHLLFRAHKERDKAYRENHRAEMLKKELKEVKDQLAAKQRECEALYPLLKISQEVYGAVPSEGADYEGMVREVWPRRMEWIDDLIRAALAALRGEREGESTTEPEPVCATWRAMKLPVSIDPWNEERLEDADGHVVTLEDAARIINNAAEMREALIRLRDCDWTIGRGDRMDPVRDIAREALGDDQ